MQLAPVAQPQASATRGLHLRGSHQFQSSAFSDIQFAPAMQPPAISDMRLFAAVAPSNFSASDTAACQHSTAFIQLERQRSVYGTQLQQPRYTVASHQPLQVAHLLVSTSASATAFARRHQRPCML